MVAPIFYGVIVVLFSDVVKSIFHITPIIFVKGFSRDLCDGLYSIITGKNKYNILNGYLQDPNIRL